MAFIPRLFPAQRAAMSGKIAHFAFGQISKAFFARGSGAENLLHHPPVTSTRHPYDIIVKKQAIFQQNGNNLQNARNWLIGIVHASSAPDLTGRTAG